MLLNGHSLKLVVSEKRLLPKSEGDADSILVATHFKSFIDAEERFFPQADKFPAEVIELISTVSGGLGKPDIQKKNHQFKC